MESNNKRFEILGYKVTTDAKIVEDIYGINEEIQNILQTMRQKVEKKKNSAIKELNELIEKYPHIPQFKNLLSVIYNKQGNVKKAHEVNHWILAEHPDYLFGKINLANEYIFKKEFDKVPEILGELMEIKDLYPNRNEFYIGEVVSFYKTAINYFIEIEDIKAAELRMDVLRKLNEEFENELSEEIENIENILISYRIKTNHERYLKQREKAREVEVIPVKVVEQTTEKPMFTNEIIEQLYCNSMRIDHNLVNQMLLLPRETLIPDLHKVVYDSVARYQYFSDEIEWDSTTHEFLTHALLLLTELKSEESIKVLLDLLRQDEEYLEFWFGDSLTEEFWEYIFVLGIHKLDAFKSFLFEPNHYRFSRAIISEVVTQIALHYPERKNEIINWFKSVIEEILIRKDDNNILDTDWVGFLISDILDLGEDAKELMPFIKELFNHELVSEDVCGSYEDIVKDIKNPEYSYDRKKEILDNIFSRYENIIASWHYYADEDDLEEEEEEKFVSIDDYNKPYYQEEINSPIVNTSKIGRNDLCPCGSGKKYKKCCLGN